MNFCLVLTTEIDHIQTLGSPVLKIIEIKNIRIFN